VKGPENKRTENTKEIGEHMKKFIVALVITTMVTISAGTASAQETRIVYIESQRILYESIVGKDAYKRLSTMKNQKEAEVKKRQAKLKGLSESLQAKSTTMTAAAKNDLEAQYMRELKDYERYVKDAQDELKRTEMNLLKPWSKELDDIIKGYAQKNGYDLVLDKSNPVIIYASGKINITSQIMDLFNKRYQEKSGKAKPKK